MDVHCTIYKHTHTHTKEWIKQLKLVHPNPEKVVAPHLHTWGPVWPDPTADSRSGRRRWDSCSCATWSGAACRFWSAPSGTAGTNTNAPICMNARSAAPSVPAALSVAFLQFILTEEDHCCICSEPMRLHLIYYPLTDGYLLDCLHMIIIQPRQQTWCVCLMSASDRAEMQLSRFTTQMQLVYHWGSSLDLWWSLSVSNVK